MHLLFVFLEKKTSLLLTAVCMMFCILLFYNEFFGYCRGARNCNYYLLKQFSELNEETLANGPAWMLGIDREKQ